MTTVTSLTAFREAPRSSRAIREQLADLMKVKQAAEAYGTPDFASKMGLIALLNQEAMLQDELRAAEMLESGQEEHLTLSGILVGGSIESAQFELKVGDDVYRGKVSETARTQMKQLTFGAHVQAQLRVTRMIQEETAMEPATSYFLDSMQQCDPC